MYAKVSKKGQITIPRPIREKLKIGEDGGVLFLAEDDEVVLAECVYVLEKFYRVPRNEVADTLSRILTTAGIINTDKPALLLFRQSKADIVDCLLAASSSPQVPVVSFDKDLDRLNAFTETL